VAAYCDEIAENMKLPARDRALLRQLAMRHHTVPHAFGSGAAERLAADLGFRVKASDQPRSLFEQLTSAFAGDTACPEEIRQLALLVEMAEDFDTEIEFLAYSDFPGGRTLREAACDVFEHPALGVLLPEFRRYSREQLASLANKLPVFPPAALQVMRAARAGNLASNQLVEFAARDQVLAGSLLAAANAAAYTWSGTVRNLQSAVLYLGDVRASAVLISAALKPVLGAPGSNGLWVHSVLAASAAEQLATMSGQIQPGDAYTVGLLHDVGKLLIRLAPAEVSAVRQRLIRNGCATSVAEVLTCGATHAEAGADVLRHWGLPADYIEAVEFHHEPEHVDLPLASLLYLAEQCTGSEEDLPSAARMRHALDVLGVTGEQLASCSGLAGGHAQAVTKAAEASYAG
jgi:HD-like signal output (HDOD) protein